MLLFLISCFSFIILSKSFSFKQRPSVENDCALLSTWVPDGFSFSWLKCPIFSYGFYQIPKKSPLEMAKKKMKNTNVDEEAKLSLLDLPELTLECILERLSPSELCTMASVCSYLRDFCESDHLWKKHMKMKWGRLMGDAASREWKSFVASKRVFSRSSNPSNPRSNLEILGRSWPFSYISRNAGYTGSDKRINNCLDSIMSRYLSLENGKFWFPAQVFNRENGHVGFMLSCYDAKLCYDSKTDTFRARYSPHGRRTTEENITWDRLRAVPVDTPSRVLHVSDCLHDLKPDDHLEIQWRRHKEFPYGWWYAIVGHLETCDGNENCCCHSNENVVLEFNQFKPGSPWRRVMIKRTDHRETGNEADGFYGGIRKLQNQDEILKWKLLWPNQIVE